MSPPPKKKKKANKFIKGVNKWFSQVKTNVSKGQFFPAKEATSNEKSEAEQKTLKQRFITFDEEFLIILRDLEKYFDIAKRKYGCFDPQIQHELPGADQVS